MTDTTDKAGAVASENENPQPSAAVKQVSLPELGPTLPIGVDGSADRSMSFKRWNLRVEKELGEKRKAVPNANLGEWASILLSEMATKIGPHDFTQMKEAERRLALSQMYMQDVLYAYLYLRYAAMGASLKIDMECPYHEYSFVWPGDLSTLMVRTIDKLEAACWNFELQEPTVIRNKPRKRFHCGPVRWHAIEEAQLGRRVNQGQMKAIMIHASILKVDDEEIALAEHELDEMTKLDLERHIAEIDRYAVGPDLSLDVRCPDKKCDRRFRTSLDWSYDTFFAISSR